MKWSRNRADAASRRSKARIALAVLGTAVLIYGLTAYVLLPWAWTHYEHQKGLAGRTMVTRTSQDIPGDAINVGLVATREDVLCAMHAAGWHPADPITFRDRRQRHSAQTLQRCAGEQPLLRGRRQDHAFEKPVGDSADRRHHVRF
jgi:LssY C-terminus